MNRAADDFDAIQARIVELRAAQNPPVKLSAIDSESERAKWKVVICETGVEVPGLILSASCETGLCLLRLATGAAHEYNFGPDGLRIMWREQ